jgi:phospholipase D1/2
MGWFISPELYLRRPPAFYPEWRLDKLLKKKAEQGVKVYVIVYEEVRRPGLYEMMIAHRT